MWSDCVLMTFQPPILKSAVTYLKEVMSQVFYWTDLRLACACQRCDPNSCSSQNEHQSVCNNEPRTAMNMNSESPLTARLRVCLPLPLLSPSVPLPENHSAPPDVTGYSSDSSHSHTERHHMANMGTIARNTQKYGNAERMETGDGEWSAVAPRTRSE